MKGNELMIGDWVYFHNGTVVEPRRVTGVLIPDCIYLDLGYKPHTNLYTISSVEPIPLTSEILEKNGWHQTESPEGFDMMVLSNDNQAVLWWFINTFTLMLIGGSILKIKYVHELQHALRLCGIKRKIIL